MGVQGRPSVASVHTFAESAAARTREKKAGTFPDRRAHLEKLVGQNAVEAPSEIVDQKASQDWSTTPENSAAN